MDIVRKSVLAGIATYRRFISPLLPPACRFWPTCSDYSYQAISKYGLLRGLSLSVRRLGKCHPFHPGGSDPLL
ncbi:MAG: membrane protein insertion efficiency factor YidD [Acidobacteriota bacterium]